MDIDFALVGARIHPHAYDMPDPKICWGIHYGRYWQLAPPSVGLFMVFY
jgi:hypothetical protein